MRASFAIAVLASSMFGCIHTFDFVPVSTPAIRAAEETIAQQGKAHLKDDDGNDHVVTRDTPLYFGTGDERQITFHDIKIGCRDKAEPCVLDHPLQFDLAIPKTAPDEKLIGGSILGVVVLGASVGLNYECFHAWCGTYGKVTAISYDVIALAVVAIYAYVKHDPAYGIIGQ